MKASVCPTAVPTHTRAHPRGTPKIAPPAIAKMAPGNMMVTAAVSTTCAIACVVGYNQGPELLLSASQALVYVNRVLEQGICVAET